MKRLWVIRCIKGSLIRVLPWIGGLVVVLCSSITTPLPGEGAPAGNQAIGTLDREHSFGQTFTPAYPQLAAIQVRLLALAPEQTAPIIFRLRRLEAGTPDLVVVSLPVHALAQDGMTTFAFAPLPLEPSTRPGVAPLQFTLEAPSLRPEEGVTVVAGPDLYPQGVLLADGAGRDGSDLAFQPVYLRRWFDAILPVSWLAAGKPGLLGWPPFYALLVYGYGYLLVQFLIRFWRMGRQRAALSEGEEPV